MEKPNNYARFYGLLNQMPSTDKEEMKKDIVLQYTKGRTDSLREMSLDEYKNACKGMKEAVNPMESRGHIEFELRRWRSAVLHQLQLIGIDTTDWNAINAYCLDKRIAGKAFNRMDINELEELLKKLRVIKRKMV